MVTKKIKVYDGNTDTKHKFEDYIKYLKLDFVSHQDWMMGHEKLQFITRIGKMLGEERL